MGDQFLVTTTRGWGHFDGDQFHEVDSCPVGYYGVTWDKDHIYAGKKIGNKPDSIRADSSTTQLVVYDRDFKVAGRHHFGGVKDCHQIVFHDGFVMMANSGKGALTMLEVETEDRKHKTWKGLNFQAHFNSITPTASGYLVCHHRRGGSHVLRLDRRFRVKELWKVGRCIHNVYGEGRKLYICNSHPGEFIEFDADSKKVTRKIKIPPFMGQDQWFTRGIARGDGFFLVGLSVIAVRKERRHEHDCAVVRINERTFQVEGRYVIPNSGGITDIRLTSEPDRAHNGIEF